MTHRLIEFFIHCSFPDRVAVIVFGIITLIAGVILSSVPWLNYFILKVTIICWRRSWLGGTEWIFINFFDSLQNLRLWNGTLSFHYWQRPGVIRLTKVYIFNVTNPEGFLNGEKPVLVEVGPFVYRWVSRIFLLTCVELINNSES